MNLTKLICVLTVLMVFDFGCTKTDTGNSSTVTVVPVAPSNLRGTVLSTKSVSLQWTDNSTNEDGFKIERKIMGGNYTLLTTIPTNIVNLTDSTLSSNTTYIYRIYSYNSVGLSLTYSNEVTITTTGLPSVTTSTITNISAFSAKGGGVIINDGGTNISSRGICWSTSPNPTLALTTKKNDSTGLSSFNINFSGLSQGTTYYVRAFATNSVGTKYGNELSFTTAIINLPTLTTTIATSITDSSATSGGNIISDGGGIVTSRGICWGTSSNPTISLSTKTNDGSGISSFTSKVGGLIGNTAYYVRAYATNSAGTNYGTQISFTTLTKIYSIGDTYGGGIIYYLDNTNKHGLIAALIDQSQGHKWDSGATASIYAGAVGTAIGTGSTNTSKIIAVIGNGNNAASVCVNYHGGGYNDWFLPSQDELTRLLGTSVSFGWNIGLGGYYWTSTEIPPYGVLYCYFGSGSVTMNASKYYTAKIRAIRAF